MVTFDLYPRLARHIFAALLGAGAIAGGFFSAPLASLVAAAMMAALLYRHCLTLDLESRTYRLQRGFSQRTGTFADLKEIEVQLTIVTSQSGGSQYFMTSMLWVNGKQNPWVLGYQKEHSTAMEEARRIGDRLALPIFESKPRTVQAMTGRRRK